MKAFSIFAVSLAMPLLSLTGCGFHAMMRHPNYQQHPRISVEGMTGELNQRFYQHFVTCFHYLPKCADTPRVHIVLSQEMYDTSYGQDATALRSQNVMHASYTLTYGHASSHQGKVTEVSSYHVDRNDEFATLSSRLGNDINMIEALAESTAHDISRALQSKT